MITLSIPITEKEFSKLGLDTNKISYNDLKEKMNIEIIKDALLKCNEIAKRSGISDMTSEEIDQEIKEVRKNAKNSH